MVDLSYPFVLVDFFLYHCNMKIAEGYNVQVSSCRSPRLIRQGNKQVVVNCGHCSACLAARSSRNECMCKDEDMSSPVSLFVTATYSSEWLPRLKLRYNSSKRYRVPLRSVDSDGHFAGWRFQFMDMREFNSRRLFSKRNYIALEPTLDSVFGSDRDRYIVSFYDFEIFRQADSLLPQWIRQCEEDRVLYPRDYKNKERLQLLRRQWSKLRTDMRDGLRRFCYSKLTDYYLDDFSALIDLQNFRDNDGDTVAVLYKKDVQRYIESINKRYSRYCLKNYGKTKKLRYAYCGEYGPTSFRPHYHFVFWFESFSDAQYMAKCINSLWFFGNCDTQFAKRQGTCGYVGGYINGHTFLPNLLKDFSEFKPFFGHSQRLGSDVSDQFARSSFKEFEDKKKEIAGSELSVQLDYRLQIRDTDFLRPFFIERDAAHIEYLPNSCFKARYLAELPSLYECDRRSFSLFFKLFGIFKRKGIFCGSAKSDAFTVIQYLKRQRFRKMIFSDSSLQLGIHKRQAFPSFIRMVVSPFVNAFISDHELDLVLNRKLFGADLKNGNKPVVFRGKDYTFKHFLLDRFTYLFQRINKIVNLVENFYHTDYETYYDYVKAFAYSVNKRFMSEFSQLCSNPQLCDFVSGTHPLAILRSGFSYQQSLFFIAAQEHINEIMQNRIKKKWLNDAHEIFYKKYINSKRKLNGKSDVSFRSQE